MQRPNQTTGLAHYVKTKLTLVLLAMQGPNQQLVLSARYAITIPNQQLVFPAMQGPKKQLVLSAMQLPYQTKQLVLLAMQGLNQTTGFARYGMTKPNNCFC